jgi:hypothetical protein
LAKYGRPDFGGGGTAAGTRGGGRARVTVRRVSNADAKEVAEKAAGVSRPRLPQAGRDVAISNKPAKIVKVKPSEKLTGRPAGESTVTKTKKPDVKPSMTKKIFKDYGGGSVSPGQRAAIKAQMDKGLKPDSKITEAKIPKTEPVRPPKDKPRVFKKVIKKVAKAKPVTTPKPRRDKPVQGPAKIKKVVPKKKFVKGAKPKIGKLRPDKLIATNQDLIKDGIPRRSTKAEIEAIIKRRGGM